MEQDTLKIIEQIIGSGPLGMIAVLAWFAGREIKRGVRDACEVFQKAVDEIKSIEFNHRHHITFEEPIQLEQPIEILVKDGDKIVYVRPEDIEFKPMTVERE